MRASIYAVVFALFLGTALVRTAPQAPQQPPRAPKAPKQAARDVADLLPPVSYPPAGKQQPYQDQAGPFLRASLADQ